MPEPQKPYCPECDEFVEQPDAIDRRNFIRALGQGTAALAVLGGTGLAPRLLAADTKPPVIPKPKEPAESLVKELYGSLSADQKKEIVLPWDHGAGKGALATRLRMYNGPINKKTIGEHYTKTQQELIQRILRAIASDDDGFRQLTRNGTFDGSKSLEGCGVTLFGEVADGKKWAWLFTGHHLTVRCDGNSEEGAAFGGPMYYGHSPHGYSAKNIFYYQTRAVLSVYDALSEQQRKKAVVKGSPGEHEPSVRFRARLEDMPGVLYADLTSDQRKLVEEVMREVLSPYRKEDVDEVMGIVKKNGGMEKIHLAFYQDDRMNDEEPWHFWRLEGPGFVWNYRILPHVHTYVNISSKV
jgi:hypothetical protein